MDLKGANVKTSLLDSFNEVVTKCLITPILEYLNCKLIYNLLNLGSRSDNKLGCLSIRFLQKYYSFTC